MLISTVNIQIVPAHLHLFPVLTVCFAALLPLCTSFFVFFEFFSSDHQPRWQTYSNFCSKDNLFFFHGVDPLIYTEMYRKPVMRD